MSEGAGGGGTGSLLSPAVQALTADMAAAEARRSALHAAQCRQAVALHRAFVAAGHSAFVADEIAALLSCTDYRAQTLLAQGLRLAELDGAFTLLEAGHFTVEQTTALLEETAHLEPAQADTVIRTVQARHSAVTGSGLRGPGPVRGAARRAAQQHALDTTRKQRQRAEAGRDVQWWTLPDGMIAIKAVLPAAIALACLDRLRVTSTPLGRHDTRTAAQRRADAFAKAMLGRDPREAADLQVDLLTGEVIDPGYAPSPLLTDQRPDPDHADPTRPGAGAGAGAGAAECDRPSGCSCPIGTHVPCGPLVHLHMSLATARGTSQHSATLVGYGPIDADHARDLLHSDARLVRVLVDPVSGIPTHLDSTPMRPGRDPDAVRAALDQLAATATDPPPPGHHPLWPGDHPPGGCPPPTASPATEIPATAAPSGPPSPAGPAAATGLHPAGQPGPYVVPAAVKRFLRVRSPRCEWAGCQQPAQRCDLDHDRPWPVGPTCSCNLGALCRHHHQVKQHGWRKTRQPDGTVSWTSPTGRALRSEPHHQPPDPSSADRLPPAPLPRCDRASSDGSRDPRSGSGSGSGSDPGDSDWGPWTDRTWTTDLDDPIRALLIPAPRDDQIPPPD